MLRARMVTAIRRCLDDEGFVEVETPVLQPRYGGAFAGRSSRTTTSSTRTLYLRIATELYLKRLIVGGLERVYEIGKDFRNEGVSFKHNPEFTMLEWYEAYADYRDTMARMEQLVARVAARDARHDDGDVPRPRGRPRQPGAALKLVDALAEHDLWTRDEAELRARLEARERRHLARPHVGAARRPRALALRRAAPDPADDPLRLPGRALAVRAHDRRRPGSSSGSSTSSAAWSSATRSRRSTTPRSRRRASRCRRPRAPAGTSRPSRATPTTSRRSRTACRRRAGSASASTASRWCSRGKDSIRDVILFPALRERR